ncbi:MAG: hypothetical protein GQ545_01775 [Candidatus Aminicenantes bacterium]|nr:hypothetical protein [Candidatus Aminicenantes bacterium]
MKGREILTKYSMQCSNCRCRKYYRHLLVFTLLIPISASFAINDYNGTLLTTIITKNHIYLSSDGIAVDSRTDEIISIDLSKVHKISDSVGVLIGGIWIHDFDAQIKESREFEELSDVVSVANAVEQILKQAWEKLKSKKDRRMFVLIVGYDKNKSPRLFYIDSQQHFLINERKLFQDSEINVELCIMPHKNSIPNDWKLLRDYIKNERKINPNNIHQCMINAFSSLAKDYSKVDDHIGGTIFYLILNQPHNTKAFFFNGN